jgi:hypothetical protein
MPSSSETTATMETTPASSRFHVALQCPTPVAFPELDVEADDEAGAWRAFCTANAISDSEHPRTIARI